MDKGLWVLVGPSGTKYGERLVVRMDGVVVESASIGRDVDWDDVRHLLVELQCARRGDAVRVVGEWLAELRG